MSGARTHPAPGPEKEAESVGVGALATQALTDLAELEARDRGIPLPEARRRVMETPRGRALHHLRSPAWRALSPVEAQRRAGDGGCAGDLDLASEVVSACMDLRARLERA